MSLSQHFAKGLLALGGWKLLDGPPVPAKAVLVHRHSPAAAKTSAARLRGSTRIAKTRR